MAGVEIGTLRLRGPPYEATRAAFRIEDGLRTELADSQRLVLIRRMRPGRRAVSGRPEERSGAIRLAYEAATRDGRHGRDAGDGASVNCVWFESPAEARRLLLAELLAGRRPGGWFWRLAVPEWQGRELDAWLVEIVERLLGSGDERESLALILFALEHSGIDVVLRAVHAAAPAFHSSPLAPIRWTRGEEPVREERGLPDRADCTAESLEAAAELRALLPGAIRDRIETLARRLGPGGRPVLRLLERLLLQASPSLALAPEQLRKLASAWSELLAAPAAAAPPAPGSAGPSPQRPSHVAEAGPAPPSNFAPAPDAPADERRVRPSTPPIAEPPRLVADPRPTGNSPLISPDRNVSEAAGLWLAVPSLIRLGFREWLCERPPMLRQDAGRTLLRTLARHYRVPAEDPALAAFEALEEIGETPDWARCWRSGLDGWLRRRTRVPLHRLVWKRGEVALAEDALTIRFPLDAADIRLRRRALDVDPGWVDWLGLCVRYRYVGKGR